MSRGYRKSWHTCPKGHSLEDAYVIQRTNGKVIRRCKPCHLEAVKRNQQYRRKLLKLAA